MYVDDTNGAVPSESKLLFQNAPDCDLKKTEYLHLSPLREDAVSVLKRDPDFVRSILVSVRLQGYHKRNGLTPIPEGKLDSIPRPIWPQDNQLQELPDDDTRAQKPPPRHKHKRWKYDHGYTNRAMAPPTQKSLPEILRELSVNINNAMANADRVEIPPETVLQSLREKINKCLDTVSPTYEDSFKDSAVATLSRAFSFVNSFNDGSQEDIEKGRLLLLKRLGKFLPNEPRYEHVQRSSSSSSSGASTSGFSDLTHTPASSNSSASDSPPASRSTDTTATADGSSPAASSGCEKGLVKYDGKSALRTGCDIVNLKRAVSFNNFQYRGAENRTDHSANGTGTECSLGYVANEVDSPAAPDTLLSVSEAHYVF